MFKYFIPFILIALSGLNCKKGSIIDHTGVVKNGIADLRNKDLQDKPIALNGEWAFAWNQLLTPVDSQKINSHAKFPALWNDKTVEGQQLNATGYGTYQLTVLLPKGQPPLALRIPDFYSSSRLYVNGNIFANSGSPATSKNNYTPHWISQTLLLPANSDTLRLLLQVANFSHAKGGTSKEILIGDNDYLQSARQRRIGSDFLLAGCLFMGGLFFFGLYLFGKNDKAMLYFSLFSMVYSYRIVGSSSYTLHSLFPNIDWEFTIRLEYFTLFGSIFLFLQYVRELYPKDILKPISKILSIFCLLVTLTPIFTPTLVFTQILNPFLAVMYFCMGYVLFVFIKAWLKKRPTAAYALISLLVLLLVMVIVNLEYFGFVIPEGVVIFSGYVGFFFLQSLILSFRFANTLQQAKSQAEQGLRAKSEFLSTMSHEIRTPLNSVIGMSHMMLKNNPRKDQREQLDVMLFSARNLLSIVNNILDYSKIEAGKICFEMIEMDIAFILQNIVSALGTEVEKKGIGLKLKMPERALPLVAGDPTLLTQVINNLVGNAIKFTPQGEVVVEVIVDAETEEQINLIFKIKDTGIGISKEEQQLIFEQFTQADSSTSRGFGGTGLGLAISKKILGLQGAVLELESEVGKGSIFYFTKSFPIVKSSRSALTTTSKYMPEENDRIFEGIHILLVEDNPINVLVAKNFLESWGAVIEVAENGQEALDLLDIDRHKIILMDLHMPVMDGFEATKKIRRQGITIPIIALTASLPNEVTAEEKDIDIDGMVLKPFNPEELYNMVSQFCLEECRND